MKRLLLLASVSIALGGCAQMQQKIDPYLPHHYKPVVKAEPKPVPVKPVEPGTFEIQKPAETPAQQVKRRWHFPAILRRNAPK